MILEKNAIIDFAVNYRQLATGFGRMTPAV